MQPITHAASQWRQLCDTLGRDPERATAGEVYIEVSRRALGTAEPPPPVVVNDMGETYIIQPWEWQAETLARLRALALPIRRYPGGELSSVYIETIIKPRMRDVLPLLQAGGD